LLTPDFAERTGMNEIVREFAFKDRNVFAAKCTKPCINDCLAHNILPVNI